MLPCVLFENEHLLVVDKPAGVSTHAPSPYAGEGLYEWLRDREIGWSHLAIIHRLDKETSGVLVFAKTALGSKALTQQFTAREVQKRYHLVLADRPRRPEWTVRSRLVRVGDRYASARSGVPGQEAETVFRTLGEAGGGWTRVEAEPRTGRTHQIRVHAAESVGPIVGDRLYGGVPAARLHLHAASLTVRDPATGEPRVFESRPRFDEDPRDALRRAVVEPDRTDAYRLRHGAADRPIGESRAGGAYVDRLGEYLLWSGLEEGEGQGPPGGEAMGGVDGGKWRAVYRRVLTRRVRELEAGSTAPVLWRGEGAPPRFTIRENGVTFALSLQEGYSVGLFLDQRENRRRLLINHVGAGFPTPLGEGGRGELLNLFAYTCGFSVCAAVAGARTVSLDLSRRYLEWGADNFRLNGLDPGAHEFVVGDAWDWLRRWGKRGRTFDTLVLDPPTFSTSRQSGRFQVEKDLARVVTRGLSVLRPMGVLFVSTNARRMTPEGFVREIEAAVGGVGRRVVQRRYAPQPLDFPITREEPGYLKTLWLRVA